MSDKYDERARALAKKAWYYWDYSTVGAEEEEATITEMFRSFGRQCAAEAYEDAKRAVRDNALASEQTLLVRAIDRCKAAALGGEGEA